MATPVNSDSAFSASGADVINHSLAIQIQEFDESSPSGKSLELAYEVLETAECIVAHGYKKVALQFPDELLHDSVPVYHLLNSALGSGYDLYVLADTSYGSCCVDEVAAQHVDADVVVHYGHACLSPTAGLNVIYVFGKRYIDIDDSVRSLVSVSRTALGAPADRQVTLHYDVAYAYAVASIYRALRSLIDLRHLILVSGLPRSGTTTNTASHILAPSVNAEDHHHPVEETDATMSSNGDHLDQNAETTSADNAIIFYIGGESLGSTNLIMTHSDCEVYAYDPQLREARLESSRTNKLLMRRYGLIQRAKDADVFGILVGTLGVALYLPMMAHLRKILAQAKKKAYTISIGKLNPAKLANFMEIECFVLVACPENSLIDSKDFLKPIITPFELEIALLREATWTGKYVLDFERVLADSAQVKSEDLSAAGNVQGRDDDEGEEPQFSLATGKYRKPRQYGDLSHRLFPKSSVLMIESDPATIDASEGALTVRNEERSLVEVVPSAGGDFLQGRSFQGLEQRLDLDPPSMLEQGRTGIARGYTDDHRETSGS